MAQPDETRHDPAALSARYAGLGFSIPPDRIERLARRIEQIEASLNAVRALDVSGYEPQTTFAPQEYP